MTVKDKAGAGADRLSKLFTSEFGVPLRGNRVLSGVEIVASVTSILAFVGSIVSLVGQGPTWSSVLVIWLLVLTTGLIGLVVIQERRVARRVRYAIATAASHGAEHRIRDAEAGILNEDASTTTTIPLVRDALTEIARAFTLITGSPCRACIKEVHFPEGSATPVTSRSLRGLRVSTEDRRRSRAGHARLGALAQHRAPPRLPRRRAPHRVRDHPHRPRRTHV